MPITENERAQILGHLRAGVLGIQEIAAAVGVSPATVGAVKAHVTMGSYSQVGGVGQFGRVGEDLRSRTASDRAAKSRMTTWRYGLPPHHQDFPDPAYEIDSLAALQERGSLPHLPLINTRHPPGSRTEPGDELLICVRHGQGYVAIARARVIARAARGATPEGHEKLYGVGPERWWLPVRIEKLARPHTEADLGLPERALQARGQAFVWRLQTTTAPTSWKIVTKRM